MNIKTNIFVALLMLLCINVQAQIMYSRQFKKAVENNTRTLTGVPGEEYKTNFADYKINIKFNPTTQMLEGEEVIVYQHKLKEDLSSIVFNLYRDIYKKGEARQRVCNPEDITDEGMEILQVDQKISGNFVRRPFKVENKQMTVTLNNGIKQGRQVTLRVKWRVKIAATTQHRGGKYHKNSWFIPYFYPQIAVYDDLYGWDNISHSANEEFLFEFANYDVSITLGDNMQVWATGDLVNMEDIYTPEVMDNYRFAYESDEPAYITPRNVTYSFLKKPLNVWHFKADSVADFVFACSNELVWVARGVELQKDKPRVLTSAVYTDYKFKDVINMTANTLLYLSNERPGYLYPYSHMTIFEGSGGMEFPMMINEKSEKQFNESFFVTSHEVTHTYCPFITGMYQNRFAFMDEGLTQFIPQYFQNSRFDTVFNFLILKREPRNIINEARYCTNYTAGSDDNVPIMTPSYSLTNLVVYTVNSYYKPQIAYTVIEDAVGKDVMTKILHDFIEIWAGKHPHPYDFFNLCKTISGKDLDELIYSWFFISGIPDLGIEKIDGKNVTIVNEGDMYLPIELEVTYFDDTKEQIHRNALVWNGHKKTVNIPCAKKVVAAQLITTQIPDINRDNNKK